MITFLSTLATSLKYWVQKLQVKSFLSMVLIATLLLTTGLSESQSQSLAKRVDDQVHQETSQRPKTTGEWEAEAIATENAPGERIQRIVEESAEAVKDWASLYPEVAEQTFTDDSTQTQ